MAESILQATGDQVAFVSSIELPESRYSLPKKYSNLIIRLPQDNKKEGYVVAGGLIAFTKNVKGQAKQDILNATLLAQLASDKKYNREREPTNWYGCYIDILNKLGFIMPAFKFVLYQTSDKILKMDEVVIKILSEIATREELEVITATLNAMRGMSNDNKITILFDRHGSYSNLGNFQVGCCDQAPGGEVSLSLGAFYFKSNNKDGNFIFFPWDAMDTKLSCGTQTLVLNSKMYARVRSAVSSKLGDKHRNLVASVAI